MATLSHLVAEGLSSENTENQLECLLTGISSASVDEVARAGVACGALLEQVRGRAGSALCPSSPAGIPPHAGTHP